MITLITLDLYQIIHIAPNGRSHYMQVTKTLFDSCVKRIKICVSAKFSKDDNLKRGTILTTSVHPTHKFVLFLSTLSYKAIDFFSLCISRLYLSFH